MFEEKANDLAESETTRFANLKFGPVRRTLDREFLSRGTRREAPGRGVCQKVLVRHPLSLSPSYRSGFTLIWLITESLFPKLRARRALNRSCTHHASHAVRYVDMNGPAAPAKSWTNSATFEINF